MFVLFKIYLLYLTLSSSGNWGPKIQEEQNSTKILMKAIRVIAGFDLCNLHVNPCCRCTPPDRLKDMVWPWVDSELEQFFMAQEQDRHPHITAVCTLRYFAMLRVVLLQDLAVLWVSCTDRRLHPIYFHSLFKTPEWLVS